MLALLLMKAYRPTMRGPGGAPEGVGELAGELRHGKRQVPPSSPPRRARDTALKAR